MLYLGFINILRKLGLLDITSHTLYLRFIRKQGLIDITDLLHTVLGAHLHFKTRIPQKAVPQLLGQKSQEPQSECGY